jgi:hypothetical protein
MNVKEGLQRHQQLAANGVAPANGYAVLPSGSYYDHALT